MSLEETAPDSSDAPSGAELIERAVGILMEHEIRSAEEAFGILEERAGRLGMRLEDTAEDVVDAADQRRSDLHLPEGFADRLLGRAQGD